MLNNIPAHNRTVYSYLRTLLTDRHKVSALYSQSQSPYNTVCHVTQIITCVIIVMFIVAINLPFTADIVRELP